MHRFWLALIVVAVASSAATAEEYSVLGLSAGYSVLTPEPVFDIDRAAAVLLPDKKPLSVGDAAPTPMAEVLRVLNLLPTPQVGFVDLGCGADARWCIEAAYRWPDVPITGIEIDPSRAEAARERVYNLGLSNRITIIEGDAGEVPVKADVGVAYLFPELLARLKPRLEDLKAFASYMHQPPGLPVTKNGDTFIYTQQPQPVQRAYAVWNGQTYYAPPNGNCNCEMCQSIRGQLAATQPKQVMVASQPTGHYETRTQTFRICHGLGRPCTYENRQIQVWVPN